MSLISCVKNDKKSKRKKVNSERNTGFRRKKVCLFVTKSEGKGKFFDHLNFCKKTILLQIPLIKKAFEHIYLKYIYLKHLSYVIVKECALSSVGCNI